jgi:hypothetical protein
MFFPLGFSSSASEQFEELTPIAVFVEDSTHLIATRPKAIKMTMLQLDACTMVPVGIEAHLKFGLQGWIILPVSADIPREDEA